VTSAPVSGTEGYADEARELFTRDEGIPFADAHRAVLHLLPETIELAEAQGLHAVLNVRTASGQQDNRTAGVSWTNPAFVKAKESLQA